MTFSTKVIDGVYSRSENSVRKDYLANLTIQIYIYRDHHIKAKRQEHVYNVGFRKLAAENYLNINIWASYSIYTILFGYNDKPGIHHL